MLYKIQGNKPELAHEVFVAPNAMVIGKVRIGAKSSVWFGAVLRGDSDQITIGEGSNIQDNAVVHVDPGAPVHIGNDVTVGHLALIHGATIGNQCLIGMHSTILNHAQIGDFCLIGANALVTSNTIIPPYSLVLGNPAKVVKQLTKEQVEGIIKNAAVYVKHAELYMQELEIL